MRRNNHRYSLPPIHLVAVLALLLGLFAGLLVAPQRAFAAGFTVGNLVIYRIGDGSSSLVSTGNSVFLDEYTPGGTLVQSIPLPTSASGANKPLIASGTATSEGLLTRSADGQYLVLTGYGTTTGGSTSLSGTTGTAVPRIVGRVDSGDNIDTTTALTDFASGNNPRGTVSSNGTDLWVTGGAGGVRYATLGGSTSAQLSTTVVNLRQVNIFGGQLYASDSSGSAVRLGTVGTGLPTTSGQTITNLPGFAAATGSPYSFFFADLDAGIAGIDTLYVADDTTTGSPGGITKYSLVSGNWVSNGVVGIAADTYRGLTGSVSGTTVTLFATRKGGSGATGGGELVSLIDSSGYNSAFSGTPTLLATAGTNTAFRGVALAPEGGSTAPSITTQPQNQTINSGDIANLSVVASGRASLHYQWYQGTAPDTSTPVGSDSASFTTPALSATTSYWVRVNNSAGSVDSATATITVNTTPVAPSITTQPQSQTITSGATTTLSVVASGTAPLHYQWYQGAASDISTPVGSDSASFTTPALTATTSYWVRVSNSAGSADSATAMITVSPIVHIHDIQGASHISPYVTTVNDNRNSVGAAVTNVPGIVTALTSSGFYMQDPNPDSDPATSEGIFVFTGSSGAKPNVGDAVQVSGAVTEFRSGCTSSSCTSTSSAWNNLTTTELSSNSAGGVALTWTRVSAGNPLPAPVVIGAGGRVPPSSVIEDDANGSIETTPNTFDPANDGIDFYESLEGMRVQVNNAVAVGPTADFTSNREIAVLADSGSAASPRTARGGIIIGENYGDFNPERIILNDLIAGGPTLPKVNVADSFPGATVGVMDYSFANPKLEVTDLPAVQAGGLQKEITSLVGIPGKLTIADFNVENFIQTDTARIAATGATITNNLGAPDILAIQEIQDNSGVTDNGVVAADQTIGALINAIAASGGPTYQYREIDPVNDQDGGQPGGNIRQILLFRTDRGLAFVDRAGGTSTTADSVVNSGGVPQLQYSPGRIDPANTAWTSSRKPLAAEFSYNGQPLFVVNNHLNSKGGDQPLYGRFQPPTRSSETQRLQQAQIVHDFVQSILAVDANAAVVVLGDLNDFHFSQVLTTLKQGVLTDLMDTLPANERYTYDFEGNAQSLDHILVSSRLASSSEYDVVHVNSEFADQTSDHDPSVARFGLSAAVQASPDSYTAEAGTTLTVGAAQGVLANDTNGASTIITHTNPTHGTLVLNNDGSFTYTPNAGYTGPDSFNYTAGSAVQLYSTSLPPLGTFGGVNVTASGYGSAVTLVPGSTDEVYGLTDRGPNVDGPNGTKVEPIPSFAPAIGKFKLVGGQAVLEQTIPLQAADGTPFNGQVNSGASTGETITDLNGNVLPASPYGYDSEGLVALADGSFWVSDEYGPFITHFDASGKQIEQISPFGPNVQGHQLPQVLAKRRVNRGMEGLTITPDGLTLVGIMQSPLINDITSSDTSKTTTNRIVTYNLATGATKQYLYLLDNPATTGTSVSEITALSNTTFLVDERDGNFLPGAYKKLYRIDISGATDVGVAFGTSTLDPAKGLLIGGTTTIEALVKNQNTAPATATLASNGITPASKSLYLDVGALLTSLDSQGRFFAHDKIEGVAVMNGGSKLLISNDSDFGIDGVTNSTPPFQLHAKITPAGKQDDGEYLVVDLTHLPATTSSATVSITVQDTVAPETSITSQPTNPSNSATASFTFSGSDAGTGVASYECSLDGANFVACTSPASYTVGLGSHTFQVRAVDGVGNRDATPASYTWMVVAAATTTSFTTSANPAVTGQQVVFTANVSADASAGTPGGTVAFLNGTTPIAGCEAVALSGGAATCTTSFATAGNYTIKVSYAGQTSGSFFQPSSSAPGVQVVKNASQVVLSSSANPSAYKQSVTFTAVVSVSPGASLKGNVTFLDGTTALATRSLTNGTATFSTANLNVGSHQITAVYNGTNGTGGSVSTTITQVVNPASTATTLATSTNPSVAGQKVTYTATVATVAPGGGTATGTVTFYDGATMLGSANLSGGNAKLSIALAVGSHTLRAVYAGSTSYAGSNSSDLAVTVNQATTTTALTSSSNSVNLGKKVTFTATVKAVAPGTGTPTGSVTFYDGSTVIGTATLINGKATFAITTLARGSHSIKAVYSGDASYLTSTSNVVGQQVN